jgi:hypothetical protein
MDNATLMVIIVTVTVLFASGFIGPRRGRRRPWF